MVTGSGNFGRGRDVPYPAVTQSSDRGSAAVNGVVSSPDFEDPVAFVGPGPVCGAESYPQKIAQAFLLAVGAAKVSTRAGDTSWRPPLLLRNPSMLSAQKKPAA